MQMRELIDKISELYRSERGKEADLADELFQIRKKLSEAKSTRYRLISHADYELLKQQEDIYDLKVSSQKIYCEGISAARELLMDMGFDMEVTN